MISRNSQEILKSGQLIYYTFTEKSVPSTQGWWKAWKSWELPRMMIQRPSYNGAEIQSMLHKQKANSCHYPISTSTTGVRWTNTHIKSKVWWQTIWRNFLVRMHRSISEPYHTCNSVHIFTDIFNLYVSRPSYFYFVNSYIHIDHSEPII